MSEIRATLKKQVEETKKKISEKLEPTTKVTRVLKIYALGPRDGESLIRWMKEGGLVEDLLKENMELRSKYINLEARLTVLADRIAVEKLSKLFRSAREVIRSRGEEYAERESRPE